MAVLVRASFQMREFEDRFLSLGIPYRVIGGPRFYERAESRDAMAYFRLIAQGDDDLALSASSTSPSAASAMRACRRCITLRVLRTDPAAGRGA